MGVGEWCLDQIQVGEREDGCVDGPGSGGAVDPTGGGYSLVRGTGQGWLVTPAILREPKRRPVARRLPCGFCRYPNLQLEKEQARVSMSDGILER